MSLLARVARFARRLRSHPPAVRAVPFATRSGHAPPLSAAERALCAVWFERLLRDAAPGTPITVPRAAIARLITTLRQ